MCAVRLLVTGAYGTMCECFFRYKNKITAESESCFHLHKILDSVEKGYLRNINELFERNL